MKTDPSSERNTGPSSPAMVTRVYKLVQKAKVTGLVASKPLSNKALKDYQDKR